MVYIYIRSRAVIIYGSPSTVYAAAAGARAASVSRRRLAPRPSGIAIAAR
jgi:hypothetical protein